MSPPFEPPPPEFTIKAGRGTDYWRQPPNTDIRSAPVVWTTAHHLPLKSLISARVTFRAKYASQLDQAGVLINILPPWQEVVPPKFIKAGVTLFDGTPRWSSTACEWYADWAPGPAVDGVEIKAGDDCGTTPWVTILLERSRTETGTSLAVYRVDKLAEGFPRKEIRHTLRKITWVYAHPDQEWIVKVGAYAARPMNDARGDLVVEFKDLEAQWGPIFPHDHHHLKAAEAEVEAEPQPQAEEAEASSNKTGGSGGSGSLLDRVFHRKKPSQ
jgi:hypothetical protein